MRRKLKKGDTVVVISGKDKGKQGVIISFPSNKKDYVLVESVNIVKKTMKPNVNKGVEGGILEKESPIHISNVAFYNQEKNGRDKVGFRFSENGKKIRILKSNNQEIL